MTPLQQLEAMTTKEFNEFLNGPRVPDRTRILVRARLVDWRDVLPPFLTPAPSCDHQCTSQCRRTGCHCSCGEFHDYQLNNK